VDTAYPYHGGTSEVVVGKALADGYRQRVKLATKMPVGLANEASDFNRLFESSFAGCGPTGSISISSTAWEGSGGTKRAASASGNAQSAA